MLFSGPGSSAEDDAGLLTQSTKTSLGEISKPRQFGKEIYYALYAR